MPPTPDAQGLDGGFPRRPASRPADRVSGRIDFRLYVDMRDTRTMTQYAHARALHLLEDTGLDADDARYVMKRLYDLGFGYVGNRDTGPGASPPGLPHPRKAARSQRRADLIAQMKVETAQAREKLEAEKEAAIAAKRQREAAEKAARERQLAVQAVLAGMPQ